MKILAISDTIEPQLYNHFDRSRWTDLDLVISCGDLPPEYLDFLCTTLGCPVLYVRGNHDSGYDADAYSGCFNLHRKVWRDRGLTVVGFEGCRWYNGRNLQYSDEQMAGMVRRSTRRLGAIDIVVTHAPPLKLQDRPDECHTGFACYRDLIDRKHPRYFVHGHSHLYSSESRTEKVDDTVAVNAFGHFVLTI